MSTRRESEPGPIRCSACSAPIGWVLLPLAAVAAAALVVQGAGCERQPAGPTPRQKLEQSQQKVVTDLDAYANVPSPSEKKAADEKAKKQAGEGKDGAKPGS